MHGHRNVKFILKYLFIYLCMYYLFINIYIYLFIYMLFLYNRPFDVMFIRPPDTVVTSTVVQQRNSNM